MNVIIFTDSDSAARSEQPVWRSEHPIWIVLDSANPVLPSIKHIEFWGIKCSSTLLNSLFSTLLTLDHEVMVNLNECHISSRIEGVCNSWITASITTDVNKCLNLSVLNQDGLDAQTVELLFKSVQLETLNIKLSARARIDPKLWDALNSLTINRVTLSVDSVWYGLIVNNFSMLSQAFLSYNTEIICMYLNAQPNLMEAMHDLPIKSLSLYGSGEGLDINHAASLHKLLSSLKQLEKLSVLQSNDSPGLWESVLQSNDSPGLWDALRDLNIKSLSLNDTCVHHLSLFAQFLASLTQLETLNIRVKKDSHPGLFDALHGLNIKSLSLNGSIADERSVEQKLTRLFQSLTQLETLSFGITNGSQYEAFTIFQSLHGLNSKSLSLNGFSSCKFVGGKSWHCSQLFKSLIQLKTLSMRVDAFLDLCHYLPEALRGLHITRLSLSVLQNFVKLKNAELLLQSISSLTLLETLTLHVFDYIDLQLPQSLKYFNFYCNRIKPPELRDLVKALSACSQTVESKLEFGCAGYKYITDHWSETTLFPPEEYIPVQLELTVQRNITVKRFRILDRIRANRWYGYWNDSRYGSWEDSRIRATADSAWSVRDNVAVENDDYDDGIVDDETYNLFVRWLDNWIDNRISMQVQSHAASNS
ncbi:hypothetical protein DPMN_161064 [Dreissena polymorpha]|uniref:Uncharacterized protein n=1 Tax=Dreissena polymorpha TaxID=45954 RepID=A0A9D4ENZ3_DREPO|nr:hypothetical protein DPMN_161064 [Dreissena polymorpha]